MRDEELLRHKESDVKRTMEMELMVVKQEREKAKNLQTEYDKKL